MNKHITSFAFILSLLSFCFGCKKENTNPEMPKEGLVLYLPFNGNAQDESGHAQHGSISGAPQLVTDRNGNANSAYYFDGDDDFIKVPHNGSYNFGKDQDFTVSLWFKCSAQSNFGNGDKDILSKWIDGNGSGEGYPYVVRIGNNNGSPERLKKCYGARYDGNGNCKNDAVGFSSQPTDDDLFHHVIWMKKNTSVYFYLDGKLDMSASDNTICETKNEAPVYVARRREGNNSSAFKGAIDDIRIYNRSLTENEIKLLFEEK